jgi:hypothetical protein
VSVCKYCGETVKWIKTEVYNKPICLDPEPLKASSFPDPERINVYDRFGVLRKLSEAKEGYWLHKVSCEAKLKVKDINRQPKITKKYIRFKDGLELQTEKDYKLGEQLRIKKQEWKTFICYGRSVEKDKLFYLFS